MEKSDDDSTEGAADGTLEIIVDGMAVGSELGLN